MFADGNFGCFPLPRHPCVIWCLWPPTGGHENFITGAGGYLQNLVNGYGGLRVLATHLSFSPMLPPSVSSVAIRRLMYHGTPFHLTYNSTHMEVEQLPVDSAFDLKVNPESEAAHAERHVLETGQGPSSLRVVPSSGSQTSSFCLDVGGDRQPLAVNVPFVGVRSPFSLLPNSC